MRQVQITMMVGAAAMIVGAMLLVVAPRTPEQPGDPRRVAAKGEWVTRPDGRRVCRLHDDLWPETPIGHLRFCDDWQEPVPQIGQPMEGWIRPKPTGGYEIMVEGRWRP